MLAPNYVPRRKALAAGGEEFYLSSLKRKSLDSQLTHTRNPNPIDVLVGARVRVARKARGFSQAVLGDKLGLTFQQVQKYECGSNRISTSTLVDIAAQLEMNPGDLVSGLSAPESQFPTQFDFSIFSDNGAIELLRSYSKLSPRERRILIFLARSFSDEELLPSLD